MCFFFKKKSKFSNSYDEKKKIFLKNPNNNFEEHKTNYFQKISNGFSFQIQLHYSLIYFSFFSHKFLHKFPK